MKNTRQKTMRAFLFLSALFLLAGGFAPSDAEAQRRRVNRARPVPSAAVREVEERNREEMVSRLAGEINDSIRDKEYERASAQIEAIGRLVPAESMTLLRVRAWYAHATGENSQAKQLYRLILRRIESDENAGINLAILEDSDGNHAAALKIITALSVRLPDSENVKQMRILLNGGVQ
ncbi:MAG: hypothetical protein LBU46_07735 [Candidatus Accumulibacter sp.]|jgi:hypothetical protein|nr:hypothetical protein [Accumulibacter sp.]